MCLCAFQHTTTTGVSRLTVPRTRTHARLPVKDRQDRMYRYIKIEVKEINMALEGELFPRIQSIVEVVESM